jgi:hypothetical protein
VFVENKSADFFSLSVVHKALKPNGNHHVVADRFARNDMFGKLV